MTMSNQPSHLDDHEVSKVLIENADLLDALRNGPQHKPALADDLNVSPETVYRKSRKLDELRLLERSNKGYHLTNAGKLHTQIVNDIPSYSKKIYACERLFCEVPNNKIPHYTVLQDADIFYGKPVAPNQLVKHVETFTDEAENLKIHMPVVLPQYIDILRDHASAKNSTLDLLLSGDVTEHIRREYSDDWNQLIEREQFAIRRSDEKLPYSLLIADCPSPKMLLVTYGRMNGLHGVLQNDTAVSIEWAQQTFHSYWETATVIRGP